MSTRIDIQIGQALLLDRLRGVAGLNREQRLERERQAKEQAQIKAAADKAAADRAKTGTETNADKAKRKSGVPEYYTPPKVAAQAREPGGLHLGWLKNESNTYQLISGNGAAAAAVYTPPTPPAITGLPTLYVPTWSGSWSAWSHFPGGFGTYYTSPCWVRFRATTELEITERTGWYGPNVGNQIVLPHGNGLIWAHRQLIDQVWYYYTVRFTGPGSEATPNRGVQLIPGANTDDPDDLWADQPSSRRLLFQPVTAGTVITEPVVTAHTESTVYACAVTRTRAVPITAPVGLRDAIAKRHGESAGRLADVKQYIYTGGIPGSVFYQNVPSLEVDNVTYGIVSHQVNLLSSLDYRWPLVDVPAMGSVVYDNADLATALQIGSLGLASIEQSNASAAMKNTDTAGTPVLYRLLSGELPDTTPGPYGGATLVDIIASVQPLPAAFAIIGVYDESVGNIYASASTQFRIPAYAAVESNLKAGATWASFADGTLPTAPGRPAFYRHAMAPLADRVEAGLSLFTLAATTYGQDTYCRQQLLGLGFTPADLTP